MRRGALRSGQWLGVAGAVAFAGIVVALVLAAVGAANQRDAQRRLIDRVGPARTSTLQLTNDYLDEETAIRGYLLAGRADFLDPYRAAIARESGHIAPITKAAGDVPGLDASLRAVQRAIAQWRATYARPAIASTRRRGSGSVSDARDATGKAAFDRVRAEIGRLQSQIDVSRDDAKDDVEHATSSLRHALILAGIVLIVAFLAAGIVFRQVVTRPIAALAAESRRAADGDFATAVVGSGPKDLLALGADVERMRARIVAELEAVQESRMRMAEQTRNLERSNAELEQFAYVASHDLQEPLRKVASFTQMLGRRYEGQLDERADQYIHFAVDGAQRMQVLINDLLSFSRVGRIGGEAEDVAIATLVDDARRSLASRVESTGGEVVVEGDVERVVHGDRSLLAVVFQNLIGNALKFHRPDVAPVVRVTVTGGDEAIEVAVADNGIGIDPEYAERIFVIFQRLHPKERYEGTGIGLAMCRKIVEHHGGDITLDAGGDGQGAVFRFTLPIVSPTTSEP